MKIGASAAALLFLIISALDPAYGQAAAATKPQPPAIPTSYASDLQRARPLNIAEGVVTVAGRNKSWRVRPYTVYYSPYGVSEGFGAMPVYKRPEKAVAKQYSIFPYAGHLLSFSDDRSAQSITRLLIYKPALLERLSSSYWTPPGVAVLIAVDGYIFQNQAGMEHYLARQAPGRVVEYLFAVKMPNRPEVNVVYYAPLVGWSEQAAQEWNKISETGYYRDQRIAQERAGGNIVGGFFAFGLGLAATAMATAPPDPDPFNCAAKRRYQQTEALVVVGC